MKKITKWALVIGLSISVMLGVSVFGITHFFANADGIDYSSYDYVKGDVSYDCVFYDSFDNSALNTNLWTYQTGYGASEGFTTSNCWGNYELEYYKAANISVSNGSMKLTAKKETTTVNGATFNYTSGRIRTNYENGIKFGPNTRVEATISLPDNDSGLWPAFWMLPVPTGVNSIGERTNVYGTWPYSGEIDIMEGNSGYSERVSNNLVYYDVNNELHHISYNYLSAEDDVSVVHKYAVEWMDDCIKFFIGNELVDCIYVDAWRTTENSSAPYDQEFYIILNLAVSGSSDMGFVAPSTNFTEATMTVEHVAAYSITDSSVDWYDESASEYHLTSATEYNEFAARVNSGVSFKDKVVYLDCDINYAGKPLVSAGSEIGAFMGTFDGCFHTISNFTIYSSKFSAPFGRTDGAVIKNLNISNPTIGGDGWAFVGGIVGLCASTTIDNCYVYGGTVTGAAYSFFTGGIVGSVSASAASLQSSYIINCGNTSTVSGWRFTGGIAGCIGEDKWYDCAASSEKLSHRASSYIINCYNQGDVVATKSIAGGIAGACVYYGYIDNCYAVGQVSTTAASVSELSPTVGRVWPDRTPTVKNCYTTGTGAQILAKLNANRGAFTEWIILGGESYPVQYAQTVMNTAIYNANGGEFSEGENGTIPSICEYYYIDLTAVTQNVPTRTGYNFSCWTTTRGSTTAVSLPYYAPNGITLYAVWTDSEGNPDPGEPIVDGETDDAWYYDDTEADMFTITSAAEFGVFRQLVTSGITFENKTVTLTHSISLSGYTWSPIGGLSYAFRGTFNGSDCTISGLSLNTTADNSGLFGTNNGTIKNLVLSGTIISNHDGTGAVAGINNGKIVSCINNCSVSGKNNVGGIAGSNTDGAEISGSYNYGAVTASGSNIGGICGKLYGTVSDCNNNGAVWGAGEGSTSAGGIAGNGLEANSISILGCTNNGSVAANSGVGGIIGQTANSTIRNSNNRGVLRGQCAVGGIVGNGKSGTFISACTNYNTVSGSATGAGGIAGCLYGSAAVNSSVNLGTVSGGLLVGGITGEAARGTIINCNNSAAVSGMQYVGGIAGSSKGLINQCYNAGALTSASGASCAYIGGIVGQNKTDGIIKNSYNTGAIDVTTDKNMAGGLCGENYGIIVNCYNTASLFVKADYIGGLVGYNRYNALIVNCLNIGDVSAVNAGGISERNHGSMDCCYNAGNIISGSALADKSIVYHQLGEISRCATIISSTGTAHTLSFTVVVGGTSCTDLTAALNAGAQYYFSAYGTLNAWTANDGVTGNYPIFTL